MPISFPAINPNTASIQEVIDQLGVIISWAEEENNALGYFPYLYQQVTISVAEGIKSGRFEDGARMERLDVIFANRYFAALHQYFLGDKPTTSWQLAFDVAEKGQAVVLQHILLGINAHINLDLGLAAGKTSPGAGIEELDEDFKEINRLLGEKINEVQASLNRLSIIWKILDVVGAKQDEVLASFSIKAARKCAWKIARKAAKLDDTEIGPFINLTDQETFLRGRMIAHPPSLLIRGFIWMMVRLETDQTKEVLRLLKS